jgi:uroporphyrin-3 C-methyltransferase
MSEENANSPSEDAAGVEPAAASPRPWFRHYGRLPVIAAAAFFVLIVVIFWTQYRGYYSSLSAADQSLLEELELTRASLSALEAEQTALATQLEQREADVRSLRESEIARLRDDIDQVPVEIRALERRVDELQGGRIDARENWLREQAEYYLVLANTELGLGRRIDTAIEALTLADSVLRSLGDPGLAGVRSAITGELQALRAIVQPDFEALVFELGNLSDQAPELPMRDQAPENFAVAAADDEQEAGLSRLLSQTRGAMSSIVRVERQEGPIEQVLTETERRIVRRQFTLEIALARVALVDGRQADFRASLVAADGVLNRDFNREAQSVVAARQQLAAMMPIEIAPELPDISDSLRLLRRAAGRQ